MNSPQQDQGGLNPVRDAQQGASLVYFVASLWAMSLSLGLRRGSGKEYCGFRALGGLLFPFVFAMLVPDPRILLVVPYCFVSLIAHRVGHLRAYWRGERIHTQYGGFPWAALFFNPRGNEVKAKTVIEPLLVMIAGVFLTPFSGGLMIYCLGGGFAMLIKQTFDNIMFQRQLDRMHDAQIENEYLLSHVRGPRRAF